jgi:acyl transferase domain-containing protein/NADP-dependent 3-hydroxy acid dehydrogenase YdfG
LITEDRQQEMIEPYPPIAVVGVSALFPGSADARGFWRDILAGKDLLTDVPDTHWLIEDYYHPDPDAPDKMYCRRGGFLQDTPFSPLQFGVPPNILPATDTAQLLALIVARRVLEDATGGDLARLERQRVSVMLGVASTTELTAHMAGRLQRPLWLKAIRASGLPDATVAEIDRRLSAMYVPWQESTFPGLLANVVSGRIANQMDLGGTNCVIDAACASSLAALSAGLNELYLRQADLVIAGGVDTLNDILMFMCFAKTTALSPTEDCRPFSAQADGTMLGEGLGMFALKRLDDAERDGNRIYAVIRGLGSSSDGYAKSIYAPRPEGQALALRRAYERAGYAPQTVELVEAHGTATKAGDRAEFDALRTVFDESAAPGRRPWCALGSVKSQIGHTKAAAGAASLFKAIMALHHKVLPPTIKVDAPNPDLRIDDSPFYLNTSARPWIHGGPEPRRAAVSSFGFGGTNFHVTLEEYTPAQPHRRIQGRPAELVLFSSSDPETLIARCRTLAAQAIDLRSLARETQLAFDSSAPARLAVVAADAEALARKVEQAIEAIARQPERTWSSPDGVAYSYGEAAGAVALLFPGQGSQYLDMGRDVALHFDDARAVWDRAAAMPLSDAGVHEVVFPPPVFDDDARRSQRDRLTRTEWAQSAIAVMSASLLSIVRSIGVSPACVAGHSFGEITALHAAGVLDEADLMRVARERGALMAAAPAVPGAMTAVSTPGGTLRDLIARWDLDVVVANCNSPSQTVLSGATTAIEAAEHALADAGMVARRLAVSTAFHSPLVSDASDALRAFLDDIVVRRPSVPVLGNADARPYPDAPDRIRDRIAEQLASPVLFEQQIHAMYEQGVRTFLEVGPGSVLSGLVDECLRDREHVAIPLDRRGKDGVTVLFEAIGRLAVRGVPIAFEALWEDDALEASEPEAPSGPAGNFVIPIRGANYGKPYPAVLQTEPLVAPIAPPAPTPIASRVLSADPRPAADPQPVAHRQPAPSVPAIVTGTPAPSDWLLAHQHIQQQIVDAQATFQRLMTESHLAFLKASEQVLQQLAQERPETATLVAGGPTLSVATAVNQPPIAAPESRPLAPVLPPTTMVDDAPPPVVASPSVVATAPPAALDLGRLLLDVVSEKTGYPVEMLDLSMMMEADLGIDSIKRVQILSAVQDRVPNLPEVDMRQLAGLRTLGEILVAMQGTDPPSITGVAPDAAPDAPPAHEAARAHDTTSDTSVRRFAVRAIPAPPTSFALPGLRTGTIAVTDDGTGVAHALVSKLARCGLRATVAATLPDDASAVIFLGGLRPVTTVDAAVAVNTEAFEVARSVAARMQTSHGLFVTVQDTGDSRGTGATGVRPWLAGLGALAKTAAIEWPGATVKAIDIDRHHRDEDAIAEAILDELLSGGPELEVALSAGGRRTVPCCVDVDLPSSEPCVDERSVILASGGARGVTAAALLELARRTRARFILLGRTALIDEPSLYAGVNGSSALKRVALSDAQRQNRPTTPRAIDREVGRIMAVREIRATLDAFAAADAQAQYLCVDVRDAAALAEALASIRRVWGPITGVVHGAGIVADATIANKTREQFDEVFSTKVHGLGALLDATAHDPLRLLCLFSSVAARYGNAGQSDYAMANEILNHVAREEARRRGPHVRVKSIDWGPWEAGMVTPELRQHFADRGVALIPLHAGAAAFVDEIQSGNDDVEVVIGASLAPPPNGETTVEVVVDAATHPHLASHLIQGIPTLPVVQVLEWFVRLARAYAPEQTFRACRHLTVLKGVRLTGFTDGGGDRFLLRGRPVVHDSGLTLHVELTAIDGTRYYEADVEMTAASGVRTPDGASAPSDLRLDASPWPPIQLYCAERLFHGPDFQVIRRVTGISRDGIEAVLSGTGAMGWTGGPWRTDPAAIDGGLQLMLLWTSRYMERQCLPLAIGELTQSAEPTADAPLRCIVHTVESSPLSATFDMRLVRDDGQPVAHLSGVEMYVVPGGTA